MGGVLNCTQVCDMNITIPTPPPTTAPSFSIDPASYILSSAGVTCPGGLFTFTESECSQLASYFGGNYVGLVTGPGRPMTCYRYASSRNWYVSIDAPQPLNIPRVTDEVPCKVATETNNPTLKPTSLDTIKESFEWSFTYTGDITNYKDLLDEIIISLKSHLPTVTNVDIKEFKKGVLNVILEGPTLKRSDITSAL